MNIENQEEENRRIQRRKIRRIRHIRRRIRKRSINKITQENKEKHDASKEGDQLSIIIDHCDGVGTPQQMYL
jgi:hypothetical protein